MRSGRIAERYLSSSIDSGSDQIGQPERRQKRRFAKSLILAGTVAAGTIGLAAPAFAAGTPVAVTGNGQRRDLGRPAHRPRSRSPGDPESNTATGNGLVRHRDQRHRRLHRHGHAVRYQLQRTHGDLQHDDRGTRRTSPGRRRTGHGRALPRSTSPPVAAARETSTPTSSGSIPAERSGQGLHRGRSPISRPPSNPSISGRAGSRGSPGPSQKGGNPSAERNFGPSRRAALVASVIHPRSTLRPEPYKSVANPGQAVIQNRSATTGTIPGDHLDRASTEIGHAKARWRLYPSGRSAREGQRQFGLPTAGRGSTTSDETVAKSAPAGLHDLTVDYTVTGSGNVKVAEGVATVIGVTYPGRPRRLRGAWRSPQPTTHHGISPAIPGAATVLMALATAVVWVRRKRRKLARLAGTSRGHAA